MTEFKPEPLKAEFFVAGAPIPKARPRVTKRTTKAGFPITYTPKTTVQWERTIANEYKRQCEGVFFERDIPLRFYAEIVCPGTGPLSSIRGDADNHLKVILDALNTLAFSDDAQVTDAHIVKRRAHKGEKIGAYILIQPVGPIQPELIGGFMERERRMLLLLPQMRRRNRQWQTGGNDDSSETKSGSPVTINGSGEAVKELSKRPRV